MYTKGICHLHYMRAYRLANPEKRRAHAAIYRAKHKEQIRAYSAARYAADPNKAYEYTAGWTKAHPEIMRERAHRRRVALLGGFVEKIEVAVLLARDGNICGICNKIITAGKESIDHLLPISFGGEHSYVNTRLTHRSCNCARGNRGAVQLRLF